MPSLYLSAGYGGEVYVECRTCGWNEDVSDLPLADVLSGGERHRCDTPAPARACACSHGFSCPDCGGCETHHDVTAPARTTS